MFVEKLRAVVGSAPPFHTLLVNLVPQARAREVAGFRRYCLRLSRVVPEPVFVKIGANDGVSGDPISDILLANANWRGLLIEPVPHCFDRLKANFHDAHRFCLEQVAIGATAGQARFYYVDAKANMRHGLLRGEDKGGAEI